MSSSAQSETLNPAPSEPISSKTYLIAGILTTVLGLEELPSSCESVTCLWLLHPRLQSKEVMSPIGSGCIHAWNRRRKSEWKRGLIAVAFDQRNHGSREIDRLSNESWRKGNPNHAQDMFSIFRGTAMDTSLLIDHLESYICPALGSATIQQHFLLGISLGGHAAWQVIFHEPRVTAAVIITGCPDYMRLMSHKARMSNLDTYSPSNNGADFLGSKDFPAALVACALKWDPKGLLFGLTDISANRSDHEQKRLREVLESKLKGKSLLVCSGAADKLVPYHCSAPFMDFLKEVAKGWYTDGSVYIEDVVYEGIGHAYSDGMRADTRRFLIELMERNYSRRSTEEASKI